MIQTNLPQRLEFTRRKLCDESNNDTIQLLGSQFYVHLLAHEAFHSRIDNTLIQSKLKEMMMDIRDGSWSMDIPTCTDYSSQSFKSKQIIEVVVGVVATTSNESYWDQIHHLP